VNVSAAATVMNAWKVGNSIFAPCNVTFGTSSSSYHCLSFLLLDPKMYAYIHVYAVMYIHYLGFPGLLLARPCFFLSGILCIAFCTECTFGFPIARHIVREDLNGCSPSHNENMTAS